MITEAKTVHGINNISFGNFQEGIIDCNAAYALNLQAEIDIINSYMDI